LEPNTLTLDHQRAPAAALSLRWARFMVAMLGFGVSTALMIRSNLGLGPWDSFQVALHLLAGMSVGTATILVGVVIVCVTWSMGVRPGAGTIANMLAIGVFVDLVLPYTPAAPNGAAALAYYLVAIVLAGVCSGAYIGTGLGKGPRDGMVMALSARYGWPVSRVRTAIELSVLGAGWALGGPVGVGTVLFSLLIGPAMQWGLRLFRVLPAAPPLRSPATRTRAARRAA
jgi:uncharacterized membrane protein YczE